MKTIDDFCNSLKSVKADKRIKDMIESTVDTVLRSINLVLDDNKVFLKDYDIIVTDTQGISNNRQVKVNLKFSNNRIALITTDSFNEHPIFSIID